MTLVGQGAGRNIAASQVTLVGASAGGSGGSNSAGTVTGAATTGLGYNVGAALTSGSGNLLAGAFEGSGLTSGGPNIILAAQVGSDGCITTNVSNEIAFCAGSTPVFLVTGTNTPSTSLTTIEGLFNVAVTGSASAPSLTVGNSTTGFHSVSTTGIGVDVNGAIKVDWGITNSVSFTIDAGSLFLPSGNAINWTGHGSLTSPGAGLIQIGNGDVASPVAQTVQAQSVAAGNGNTAGGTFTVAGSKSNGSGGGDMVLQTTLSNAASGTQNTLATALTLKGGTQAAIFAGQVTITNIATGTGSYVCSTAGLLTVETTACPASDIAQKNPLGHLDIDVASARMDLLSASLYTYKDSTTYGDGERVGLYAQDVEKMDRRCVTYKADGVNVSTYDDRCVIAYLVADRQKMKAEIEKLERRVH